MRVGFPHRQPVRVHVGEQGGRIIRRHTGAVAKRFRKILSRFSGEESGAIVIWAAISMPMIVGLGALAFDMNNMYVTKAELRHTADAAGIAAVKALPDEDAALAAAQYYANLNMPPAEHGTVVAPGDVVAGNWDYDSRVFTPAGNPVNAVQVSARRDQQNGNPVTTSIAAALGVTSVNISASTIAAQSAGNACILALNETAADAFHLNGTAVVRTSYCDIQVNSCNAEAITANGNTLVQIQADTGDINVCGNVVEKGPALFDPTPTEGQPIIADPFQNMAFPTVGACTYTNFSATGDVTLTPGVYCGGIDLTGSGTATFTGGGASDGQYIITGGELDIGSQMTAVTDASGVTFFLTGAAATLKFTGNADIGLAAPTTGPYAGFIMFGDKNNPPATYHKIRGTALGGYNGKIYLPGAKVDMGGNTTGTFGTSDCTVIIADTFDFHGTVDFEVANGCSDFGGGGGAGGVATIVK